MLLKKYSDLGEEKKNNLNVTFWNFFSRFA